MSKYPAQIDTSASLPVAVDNSTPVSGDTVNRLRAAIIAVETELGIKPSGVYSTVRARLDYIENLITLEVVTLNGDLGGTPPSPKVVGLQGRPVSSSNPNVNQVLTWNGIAWVPDDVKTLTARPINSTQPLVNQVLGWDGTQWIPSNVSATLNVLPTSITLPVDITFLSGDGYNSISSPFRVGARAVNMSQYPLSYPDNRIRTMTFKADLEVSNTLATGFVQLKDITHNAIINNSLMSTSSFVSAELSSIITSGTTDGYMRDDTVSMYEVQIYITGGNANDVVICRNARIEMTYSLPIVVAALVPLALPTDISIVAGTELNGFPTPAGIGGRILNMNYFNPTLPDGRPRHIFFYSDVEVSAPGVDGYIQLFDTTNNVVVSTTQARFTNTIAAEIVSSELVVGASAGNIRNDAPTRYEVRIWKVSGSPADRVICNNARITIMYYY